MGGFDRERALANAEAKNRKADALERRKRTALRILDGGGTIQQAAEESRSCSSTVKKWAAEARQTASENGGGRSE